MIYTRLYSDANGESHFEDVGIELTLTNYAPPAPPLELTSFMIAMARRAGFPQAVFCWWKTQRAKDIHRGLLTRTIRWPLWCSCRIRSHRRLT